MHADTGTIGIEVTELCREGPKAEEGKLSKVLSKARERYSRLANPDLLDVVAVFAPDTGNARPDQLTKGLVNFVHPRRQEMGAYNWIDDQLPEGYQHIVIGSARESI